MHSISDNADREAATKLTAAPQAQAQAQAQAASGAPKRRHRVDSNPLANRDRPTPSSPPDPKRPRAGAADCPHPAPPATMSAKLLGKRPDAVIDLTRDDPPTPHNHQHQQQNGSGCTPPQQQQQKKNRRPPPAGFQPHTGAKKLVVKNLRKTAAAAAARCGYPPGPPPPSAADEYYRRAKEELGAALEAVFRGRPPALPLDRLFRSVEDVCRNGEAAGLYEMLQARCEEHLSSFVLPRIRAEGSASDIEMLRTVHKYWREWSAQSTVIRSTFSYLDRTFLLKNKDYPVLNDMAISLFRRMVFKTRPKDPEGSSPGGRVLDGMCELVQLDRDEDRRFDGRLLQASVSMLHVFNVYGKSFEPRFLAESERYFGAFAESRSDSQLKDYISACQVLIRREDTRCDVYNLDSTTKRQLLDDINRIAVLGYAEKLLGRDEVGRLIDESEVESLKALYELLRMSGLHGKLRQPWDHYIVATGFSIVNDSERGDEMVMRLLGLRRKLDLIVRDAFDRDEEFTYALRDAFGRFINDKANVGRAGAGTATAVVTGTSRVGEMIAKYIDMLLRGGLKALPSSLMSDRKDRAMAEHSGLSSTADEDAELDRQLDQGLELFRFIEGKDVFEAFYKRDLARRLLLGRSASQDAERNMLAKLKSECGSSFTHNLEQMFKDQQLGKEELAAYKLWRDGGGHSSESTAAASAAERDLPRLDLTVQVLSAAAWPSYPDEPSVVLPPGVAQNLNHFNRYYTNKHTGRKLEWKHSLSHCVVRASFPRGQKELVMSAHQAAVLVLFNNAGPGEPLGVPDIERASALTGDLLCRTLQSLACGRVRVLTKAPRGRDVSRTDTFVVNLSFTDPKVRVKINQIQLRETKEEAGETHARVVADRQFETQAAIVRIMKSRKTMPHAQLVAEVIEQTRRRGAMDPADIKLNIEKLIEKDYIEREGNSYVYLA